MSIRPSAPAVRRPVRLLLLPALLAAPPAAAQQEDGQLWFQVNTNVPLADRVRVTLEQIARVSERQDGLFQTEFGALLGLRVAAGIELGLGYRRVGAHNGNAGADEDRLRQQVVATFGRLTTRLRLDERFDPRGHEVGFLLRPLLRYNHPVGRGTALFVSHESFFLPNATRWGQRSGYERMRNIVGAAFPIGGRAVVDLGYLNQYRVARGGARAQMDHALNAQLTINLRGFADPRVHD